MNSIRKFGVDVVGVGFRGKNHIRVFSNLDRVNLIAMYDTRAWEEPLTLVLKDFILSLLDNRDPMISGSVGLKALEIAEAAITSARTKKAVEINSFATSYNKRNMA